MSDFGPMDSMGAPDAEMQSPGILQLPPPEPMCIDPEAFMATEDRTSDEIKAETVRRCVETFISYRDCAARKEIEFWWDASHDAYFGFKTRGGRHNYIKREIFRQCSVEIAQMAKAVFGGDEIFHCEARQEGGDEDAEGATAVLQDAIERYGSDMAIREAVCECRTIYGMGYTEASWQPFVESKHSGMGGGKLESMHGDGKKTIWERESNEVIMEAGLIESYPPWDVYSHPNIRDCRKSPMVVIRKGASAGDLKTRIRAGRIDWQATKEAIDAGGSMATTGANRNPSPVYTKSDLTWLDRDANIHEHLRFLTLDGWEYEILDQQWLVRAMKIPGGVIPIHGYPRNPHPEKHWGMPLPIVVLEDQKLLNQFLSFWIQSIDAALPRYLVDSGLQEQWVNQYVTPGGALFINSNSAVPQVQVLPTNKEAPIQLQQNAEYIVQNMQDATGSTREVAGTGSSQKTATGLTRLQDAATELFQDMIRVITPPLKDQLRDFYDIYARNFNSVMELRVSGKEPFKKYTPQVFMPNVDIKIELGGAAGIEVARGILEVIKVVGMMPPVNLQPVLDKLWKAMDWKNIKQFRSSTPEIQADVMQQCMLLQATGFIADPQPGDNHQMNVQIKTMFLQTQQLPPDAAMRLQNNIAIHMQYLQQMMAAQAQAAQASMGPPNAGASPAGQEGNNKANGMFGMDARGRGQQAPIPQNQAAA